MVLALAGIWQLSNEWKIVPETPQEERETEAATTTTKTVEKTQSEPIEASVAVYTEDRREIQQLIAHYATLYGVDASYLTRVAMCESSLNPNAYHPNDGGTPSVGILQFKHQTFAWFSDMSGLGLTDIWDPEQQIHLAAWAFANNLSSHWTCSYKV